MVAAVSNAGGLGILATGPLSSGQTREAIKDIRKLTDRPFGANATLMFPGAAENAKVLLQEQVPVINFSLGKGDWIVKEAHQYGGRVLATVVNLRHAKRAQEYGTDAIIATGQEAAAHGEDVTSLVLIPHLAENLEIPVIAAGGFADGRGLAAALALGAEGIAMGTRLMVTKESPLHENYKKLALEKQVYDTIFSKRFDGILCRVMRTDAAERAIKKGLSWPAAYFNSRDFAKMVNMPHSKLLVGALLSGYSNAKQLAYMANAFKAIRVATEEGDSRRGVLPVGQVQGLIHDQPTVAELLERMEREAQKAQDKVATALR
jgi:enoyl-[acyl-carrier protein] reductase II